MPVRNSIQKSLLTQSGDDINKAMRGTLYDLQSQTRRPSSRATLGPGKRPLGQKAGDQTAMVLPDKRLLIGISDGKGTPANYSLPGDIGNLLEYQEGTAAPTIANFPNDGDWGEFYDTTAPGTLYLVRNRQGTLVYVSFGSIGGTITDAQHGDRSTTVTTMHKFSQISGSITAAQHGDFTAIAANDNLHALATAARPGFLSASDFTLLSGATASNSNNTLVQRNGSGNITVNILNAVTSHQTNGTQVLGARNTGWTAFTGTTDKATAYATGTITLVQLAERVAALQAALTTHGAIGA